MGELVVQDTTTLNFSRRSSTKGLRPIGNKADSLPRIFVYESLCVGAASGNICEAFALCLQSKAAHGVDWIARLGGFLNRKIDGPPGVQGLWRGSIDRFRDSQTVIPCGTLSEACGFVRPVTF